jgi:hypothetical protein
MKWLGEPDSSEMVGVTIGMGRYFGKANIAAKQFTWATGLPAVIIEDSDSERVAELVARSFPSILQTAEIPYSVKLFLFDLLPQERMVYFDADIVAVNFWNPIELDPEYLHVVRDRFWSPIIEQEAGIWGLRTREYFNSGLMILSRSNHLAMLRDAAQSWFLRSSSFHDQSRLNYGAQHTGVKIHWLHRDFNVINGERTCEAGRFAVKALHLGGRWPESAYAQVIATSKGCGLECLSCKELSEIDCRIDRICWRYERGGQSRLIEFQEDGTIGEGTRNCERFWRIWNDKGQLTLGVFGYCGTREEVSETFHAIYDGACWRGRWNRFEQNEFRLTPIKSP